MWINSEVNTQMIRQVMKNYKCMVCLMGKRNKISTSEPSDPRTEIPGLTVSADPVPVNITGVNGEKLIFFFKDIATGFWIALTGKLKGEYPEKLRLVIDFYRQKWAFHQDCANG